ncbi:hypothetical protein F5880DRAFT_792901 [Lentinula raphanica]|nr:hypothetical protein F5880DRAFT_792901 [Lentinula raphanica]
MLHLMEELMDAQFSYCSAGPFTTDYSLNGCCIFTTLVVEVKFCRSKLTIPSFVRQFYLTETHFYTKNRLFIVQNMRLQRICHGTKIALLGFLTVFCNVAALPMDAHYPSSTSLGVSQLYDSEMHPRALHIEPNGWTVNIQFKGSPKYGRRNEDTANVILILQNMAQALQPYLPPGTLFYLPSQGYIPFWNADSQIKFDYYVYKELPPTSVPKSEDHKAGSGTIQKSDLQTTIIAEQGAVSVLQEIDWKVSIRLSSCL